jgi:hypothetical protein
MKTFVIFLVIAGFAVVFVIQKRSEQQSAETPSSAAAKSVAANNSVATKSQPKPELTPAPRGQASEYNYMKRALDRAADVRDQARARTKESQDP